MREQDAAGSALDEGTARAWSRFRRRLADRLADLGDDDILVVDVEVAEEPVDGAAPYAQFAGYGDGTMLRGEISSNTYLVAEHALDAAACAGLVAAGWHEPTAGPGEPPGEGSGNFFVDLPVASADRLAVMTVDALRDVFGVPHPAFLDADGLEVDADDPARPVQDAAGGGAGPGVAALAEVPTDAEHLRALVDQALAPLFGAEPEHDEDGDVPVRWGSSMVYVRVLEDSPVVELFGFAALDVTDLDRAAFEVNVLNRDRRFLTFALAGDRVMARLHVPAWPFVPEHLRAMLTTMSVALDEIDDDLVARVGGRRALDPVAGSGEAASTGGAAETPGVVRSGAHEGGAGARGAPADERRDGGRGGRRDGRRGGRRGGRRDDRGAGRSPRRRHEADLHRLESRLQTLLELDADAAGSVDPELAASICDHDRDVVVRMLAETGRQEVAWSRARDRATTAGDEDEAGACDHELRAWRETTALLRRALRLVVEADAGRSSRRHLPGDPRRTDAG